MSKITVNTVESESVILNGQDLKTTINTTFSQANTARNSANTAAAMAIAFGA